MIVFYAHFDDILTCSLFRSIFTGYISHYKEFACLQFGIPSVRSIYSPNARTSWLLHGWKTWTKDHDQGSTTIDQQRHHSRTGCLCSWNIGSVGLQRRSKIQFRFANRFVTIKIRVPHLYNCDNWWKLQYSYQDGPRNKIPDKAMNTLHDTKLHCTHDYRCWVLEWVTTKKDHAHPRDPRLPS